jgi:acetate kinase
MNFLIFNCGSSSLKFQVIAVEDGAGGGQAPRLARGQIAPLGDRATCQFSATAGPSLREIAAIPQHEAAVATALRWLDAVPGAAAGRSLLRSLDAVGHRIVHGGERFGDAVAVDEATIAALDALEELAPLHNPPALRALRACRAALGPELPVVAAFDTAFHQTLPAVATTYALPDELARRHGIRRYGFHGLSHRYLAERYAELVGLPREQVTIVTLHLGSGCSACAIRRGRSVDTSMGFTPLESLVMSTRSGDLDPAAVTYLMQHEGVSAAEVETWLNERAGLLGVSGRSADIREVLAHEADEPRCRLAVDLFCYRARKYIGAYLAALGGAQAVVFSGGIGEHAPAIRARICEGLQWCGLTLDPERNAAVVGAEGCISAAGASLQAYVIPSDEEIVIARDAARLLQPS